MFLIVFLVLSRDPGRRSGVNLLAFRSSAPERRGSRSASAEFWEPSIRDRLGRPAGVDRPHTQPVVGEAHRVPIGAGTGQDADLVVVGHQWWWEVRYPGSGAVTANEIHVPVGRKLRVRVEAADVIHSFWVPQLAPKMDMVPGHPNFLWLQADHAGTYEGACSEFCGDQHAWMRFIVIAEPESQFKLWLEHQARPAQNPTTESSQAGKNFFFAQTCANCHAIGGTSAVAATAGPDLTHLANRKQLAAGIVWTTRRKILHAG